MRKKREHHTYLIETNRAIGDNIVTAAQRPSGKHRLSDEATELHLTDHSCPPSN